MEQLCMQIYLRTRRWLALARGFHDPGRPADFQGYDRAHHVPPPRVSGHALARFPIARAFLALAITTLSVPLLSPAQVPPIQASAAPSDLTELPIEALLQMEVTTVSRKAEKLSQSPAAVSVVTQDDIRRSGATSIPEALRLVPGLDVARVDASEWAISARGFNDVFANKLLVLQDGRSIYTPLFSGVFWDVQGAMLEDIDRIEVVRGPGATLWGANAVNGVINIITKSARETQGTLLMAGGGTFLQDFLGARYGAKLGENVYFRLDGQYFDREDTLLPSGQ